MYDPKEYSQTEECENDLSKINNPTAESYQVGLFKLTVPNLAGFSFAVQGWRAAGSGLPILFPDHANRGCRVQFMWSRPGAYPRIENGSIDTRLLIPLYNSTTDEVGGQVAAMSRSFETCIRTPCWPDSGPADLLVIVAPGQDGGGNLILPEWKATASW